MATLNALELRPYDSRDSDRHYTNISPVVVGLWRFWLRRSVGKTEDELTQMDHAGMNVVSHGPGYLRSSDLQPYLLPCESSQSRTPKFGFGVTLLHSAWQIPARISMQPVLSWGRMYLLARELPEVAPAVGIALESILTIDIGLFLLVAINIIFTIDIALQAAACGPSLDATRTWRESKPSMYANELRVTVWEFAAVPGRDRNDLSYFFSTQIRKIGIGGGEPEMVYVIFQFKISRFL
ncbi:hypothetical protein B0H11DRAFT_1899120 [Mycena galericulata]|nr:hypothetical protein B0H11DRAFT_1899120 [Mycena galericulata]